MPKAKLRVWDHSTKEGNGPCDGRPVEATARKIKYVRSSEIRATDCTQIMG